MRHSPCHNYSHLLSPLCSRSMVSSWSLVLASAPPCFRLIEDTDPRSLTKAFKSQLITLIRKDPKMAVQKPWTLNPGITPEAIFSMSALMINVNRPRLKMLIGRVSSSAIGRKKAFRNPSIAAAKTAEKKPLI